MTLEELYTEVDAYYDGYERDLGMYLAIELDISYLYSYIDQRMLAEDSLEEVLAVCKIAIQEAAYTAEQYQTRGGHYDETN